MTPIARVLGAGLAVLAVSPIAGASAASADRDPDAFTPISLTTLNRPAPVLGSDGRYHLVYEVQALNISGLPWNIRSLRAEGTNGRVYARWSGKRVRTVLVAMGSGKPTARLDPGEGGLFHLTFSVARKRDLPRSLVNVVSARNATKPVVGPPRASDRTRPSRLVRRAPVVLGPPLRGSNWVAADGCCTAHRHVWATQPYGGRLQTIQRFAIDWEQLDDQGRLFSGDPKVLTNWPGYGEEELAVADGTIVHVLDGLPDQVPGSLPAAINPVEADGNSVFLRLDDGRYVAYAHMSPGSLRVKVGDRVTRGQVLGLLGNSGNSSAPHLHLHVMNAPVVLGANGLPYVFDRFTITGRIASTEAFNHAEETGEPARMGPVVVGPRTNALPLDQVVVTWG
jgi:hypothetical protein